MKIKLSKETNIKSEFFYLLCFFQFLILSNLNIGSNSFEMKKREKIPQLPIKQSTEKSNNLLEKTDDFHSAKLDPLINKETKNKSDSSHILSKENSNILQKSESQNKKNNNINLPKRKISKLIKIQKNISAALNAYSKFNKILKKNYRSIKNSIHKNKNLSDIKKCGLNLLTEIHCQYYKEKYNEKLDQCRKLKYEDFKKNCSNRKNVYIIYNLKSATNAFASFREKSSFLSDLTSGSNMQIALRSILYKNVFNHMLKPIQRCTEIPIEIRLAIIKQRRRFTFNDKNLSKKKENRKKDYWKLFEKIRKFLSNITSDLIQLKPSEEKFVCSDMEKAAKTIVNQLIDTNRKNQLIR